MARVNTIGFEWNHMPVGSSGVTSGEFVYSGPTATYPTAATVQTSVVRSGTYAAQCNSGAGNAATVISNGINPSYTSATVWHRFYLCFGALPTTSAAVFKLGDNVSDVFVRVTSAGALQLFASGSQVGSDYAAGIVADGVTWYRFEVAATGNGSAIVSSIEVRLEGVTAFNSAVTTATAGPSPRIGWPEAPGANKSVYVDDYGINDSTGAAQNTWLGDGKVVLLKPISLNLNGGSWTDDNAATTSAALTAALDNTPPKGIADTTAGGGDHQVRNAAANSSLDMNLTTYATAGIASVDTINVVIPICGTAAPVVTAAKTGSLGITTNPTIANIAFVNGGTAAANFWSGTTAGTFPTGWKWERGTFTYTPSVTVSSSPVFRVTITGGTVTRIAMVDAMGLYVDYTPAVVAATSRATVTMPPYIPT